MEKVLYGATLRYPVLGYNRVKGIECSFVCVCVCFAAILVHRWLPGSTGLKKLVHLCLQGVALASGIFGIWTKFQGQDGIVANFYSLHSWMGLICVSLFGAQVCFFMLDNLFRFFLLLI